MNYSVSKYTRNWSQIMKITEIIKGIAQMYCSNRHDINPDKIPNISYEQNMHPIWLHLNPSVIAGYCLSWNMYYMRYPKGHPSSFHFGRRTYFMHQTVKLFSCSWLQIKAYHMLYGCKHWVAPTDSRLPFTPVINMTPFQVSRTVALNHHKAVRRHMSGH